MKGKTKKGLKRLRAKDRKADRVINRKNRNLMMEKILSYSPMLLDGVEQYKDANRNFLLLIFLGVLLKDFPLIALPCCLLSMFFTVKMFRFVKYKSINTIVKMLAKDLSFKGIYDKGKVENMLLEFKDRYGQDILEYEELVKTINKYETFVTKIEYVLRNINIEREKKGNEVSAISETPLSSSNNVPQKQNNDKKEYARRKLNGYYTDFNDKLSMLCKNENGEIKKVNRAIEFFEDKDDEDTNAIILKSEDENNKNLTVYLYKKSSDLQKNIL